MQMEFPMKNLLLLWFVTACGPTRIKIVGGDTATVVTGDTDTDTDTDTNTDTDTDTDTDTNSTGTDTGTGTGTGTDTGTGTEVTPVDADGDGYPSVATGGTDCDDDDASVHPGVTEVYGDGKDNDCNGVVDDPACPSCTGVTGFSGKGGAALLEDSRSGAQWYPDTYSFFGIATGVRWDCSAATTADPMITLAVIDTDTTGSGQGQVSITTTGATTDHTWVCLLTSDQGAVDADGKPISGIKVTIKSCSPTDYTCLSS